MPEESLRGQVVLVTGGGRRIGRVIALTFARAGADVAVNYFNSGAEALRTLKEIQALGRSAIALRASGVAELHALLRVEGRKHHADALPGPGAGPPHPREQHRARNDFISGRGTHSSLAA